MSGSMVGTIVNKEQGYRERNNLKECESKLLPCSKIFFFFKSMFSHSSQANLEQLEYVFSEQVAKYPVNATEVTSHTRSAPHLFI